MTDNRQFVRMAAVWSGVSLVIGAAIAVAAGFVPLLHENTPAVTITRELVLAALHVVLIFGLLGLWRSGAAGDSTFGKVAFWLAVGSRSLFALAELTVIYDANTANVLFGVVTPLHGLGMIGVGMAVLRAKRWHGWHAFTPLLCGLYPFVIMLPAFALSGGPNYFAIAGWNLVFLLLSAALWEEASEQPVAVWSQARSETAR